MVACVAFALLAGQGVPAVLTAEEIRARMEQPVSMRTDPERLPVALDELGSKVGVRIRCEAELNRAVVLVAVRNKPAKEVFDKLLGGLGAGSIIQSGSMYVGMGVATPEEQVKLRQVYLQNLKANFENLYKGIGADKSLDEASLQRGAALALASFNRDPQFGGIQVHPSVYQVAYATPMRRFSARLLHIIGPDPFGDVDDTRASYFTMKDLPDEGRAKVLEALETLRTEQDTWAKIFAPVRKRALAMNAYWLPVQMTADAVPLEKVGLTGFRLSLHPDTKTMTIEVLSGNEPILDGQEYLPSKGQRYINQAGERFDTSKMEDFTIPLDSRITRLAQLTSYVDAKPKPYDREILKMLASPWKYDPLSFCRSEAAGPVAEKLGLNLVAYLGDNTLYTALYGAPSSSEAKGKEVLQSLLYGGYMAGLIKKDDWLLVPCVDPESYLRHQMDRAALDKFLARVYQPGCLTLDEYCACRKAIGREAFGMANAFAQIIQPGFDSLNPFGSVADLWSELSAAQKSQMANGGLSIAGLPNKLFDYVNNVAQSYGGYHNPGDPEGLYTDPPTKQEVRKAKLGIVYTTSVGFLTKYGDASDDEYQRWANYTFMDLGRTWSRGTNATNVLNSIPSPRTRLCHSTTINFVITVPRKQGAQVLATQYDADVSIPSTPKEQLRDTIARILQGG